MSEKPTIGASDLSSICGYGFASRAQLWRWKTGVEERPPSNQYQQYGKDHEYRAITAAECLTGLLFQCTGKRQKESWRDIGCCWLRSTPDGRLGKIRAEVKCPKTVKDAVPSKYLIQVTGQMWVEPDVERVLYVEWTPLLTRMWWVFPSETFQRQIVEQTEYFCECISRGVEPKRFSRKPKFEWPEAEYIGDGPVEIDPRIWMTAA